MALAKNPIPIQSRAGRLLTPTSAAVAAQAEQSTQAAGEGRLEDLADESEAGSDDLMEEQDLPIAVGELLAPADEEMRKVGADPALIAQILWFSRQYPMHFHLDLT